MHVLTIDLDLRLVKGMKLTQGQMEKLVEKVFFHWKKNNMVIFKADEKKVFARALELVKKDYQRETDLDHEVSKMIDDLERKNPGGFQKHKMFSMVKQKLAKERKIIL